MEVKEIFVDVGDDFGISISELVEEASGHATEYPASLFYAVIANSFAVRVKVAEDYDSHNRLGYSDLRKTYPSFARAISESTLLITLLFTLFRKTRARFGRDQKEKRNAERVPLR